MTPERKDELKLMLHQMKNASSAFYRNACLIGNHPFIEFTGLVNEYIQCCHQALNDGIDFTKCSTHSGLALPMKEFAVEYVNEKLECIFTGRSVMSLVGARSARPGQQLNIGHEMKR